MIKLSAWQNGCKTCEPTDRKKNSHTEYSRHQYYSVLHIGIWSVCLDLTTKHKHQKKKCEQTLFIKFVLYFWQMIRKLETNINRLEFGFFRRQFCSFSSLYCVETRTKECLSVRGRKNFKFHKTGRFFLWFF